MFPLQDLCKCEASGGQHTNHEIDKVIVAPADTDLRLTIKEDLFDLNKNIWNNLSIKSKLLNILDVPVIHNMITLGLRGNFSAVSVARSGQESALPTKLTFPFTLLYQRTLYQKSRLQPLIYTRQHKRDPGRNFQQGVLSIPRQEG